MKPHVLYGWYVARHKWFVLLAGLRVGVPLWRLIVHDWSKLTRAEWGPYVRRFYDEENERPGEFKEAWRHHWSHNKHHWQGWCMRLDGTPAISTVRMPETYAREMVADWMGAGRAITGRWEVAEWYANERERIELHPETRSLVEGIIAMLGDRQPNEEI